MKNTDDKTEELYIKAKNLVKFIESGKNNYFQDEVQNVVKVFLQIRDEALEECEILAEKHRKYLSRPGSCDAGLSAARKNGQIAMAKELRDQIRIIRQGSPE